MMQVHEGNLQELALTISMVVENLCLSSNNNKELVYCLKDWYHIINVIHDKSDNWALRTKAVLDRTRLALADKAEYYQRILQPTAEYLGGLLGIEQWAVRTSFSLRFLVHTCMHPFITSCFIHQT
jgi:alpha-glucan,water dikinase